MNRKGETDDRRKHRPTDEKSRWKEERKKGSSLSLSSRLGALLRERCTSFEEFPLRERKQK